MQRLTAALASLLALAASACSWGGSSGPTLASIDPAEAPNHVDVPLRISGRDFEPEVWVDFDDPGASRVDGLFSVSLVLGSERIALTGVARTSSTELRGTLPAGAPPGLYALEVRDPRGRTGSLPAALRIFVAQVAVTTAADEADAGATPWAPGGTGLSLREAVAWVNAQGTPTAITLAAPLTVAMSGPQTYMTLTAPGAAVVGEPGVVLDFGGINQNCLTLDGPDQRLVGVTLRGCAGTFVAMSPDSGGSQVSGVTFEVTGSRYWAYGILAQASSATPSRIGPGNDLSGLWIGLKIDGANYEIFENRIHDNSVGARLAGGAARLWRNAFYAHVRGGSNRGVGVDLLVGPGPVELLHNVFDRNGGSGVEAASVASLTVRDNLFTHNGAFGLSAVRSGLLHDHNGYFANASGDLSSGLAYDLTDLLHDPLFLDGPAGDYRLDAASPAIDAGIDTGLDVNGAEPGLFSGLAPDLGPFEAR